MAEFTVRKYASPVRDESKALSSLMGLYFMLMTFNPAINGWAIISEACRVMAKRLRDVCGLPESEPLWKAGRGFVVRKMSFENSPAIYGWVMRQTNQSSPVGTKERRYRP
jgi:hypothetical protein